jgi:KUP system potassium uptake protein
MQIVRLPGILAALDPRYAVNFFSVNQLHGVLVLGSVVLCITGGEALYADLGHFGRRAIKLSWLSLAFPALLLNYFGQCALLMNNPGANSIGSSEVWCFHRAALIHHRFSAKKCWTPASNGSAT